MVSLSELEIGVTYKIASVEDCHFTQRLLEMNIIPGNLCKIMYKAPYGDACAVKINDSFVLALRKEETEIIRVTKI